VLIVLWLGQETKTSKLSSQIAQAIAFFENHYLHEIFHGRKLQAERNSFTMREKPRLFSIFLLKYKRCRQKLIWWSLWFQIPVLTVGWSL